MAAAAFMVRRQNRAEHWIGWERCGARERWGTCTRERCVFRMFVLECMQCCGGHGGMEGCGG